MALPGFGLGALACGGGHPGGSPPDAASVDARTPADSGTGGDASAPLGWVDFAISGCTTGDGSEASPCLGPSPLLLRFTVLAPAPIDAQAWSFGDGTEPDTSLGPVHRFAEPGSYDISLNVDGPGGSAGRVRLAAVIVMPAPLGSACEKGSQCASADCACDTEDACPPPLDTGICMLDCADDVACGANVCIDLGSEGEEPWQRSTCLPSCDPMAPDCGLEASCQALRGVGGAMNFACFAPGVLAPIGASCRDAAGALDEEVCASGECLELGIRGMCSTGCDESECPSGSACITPTSGSPQPFCAPTCDTFACDADGLLSCRASGDDFTVSEAEVAEGYCTPSFP
ncbi:MAG: hypothetical protein GY811_25275 [Myxococcales bacterium]|nr:hypothetical protein [Myxococcales bacterium]